MNSSKQKALYKLNKRILIVIGLILLFNITVYVTYSYFNVVVSGNESANNTIVNTSTLELTYNGTQSVALLNAYPGGSVTKTFTVENTGTLEAEYDILWWNIINSFADKGDLVYTLTCSSSKSGKECGEVIAQTQVPNTTASQEIVKYIGVEPGEVHTYSLTITFLYKDESQNDNQGKSLSANIQINEYSKPTINIDIQDGTSGYGNNALTYPVGLITADEVMYAGIRAVTSNQSNYLNTGSNYWTSSPFHFESGLALAWLVSTGDHLGYSNIGNNYGAFPSISLTSSATTLSGNGLSSSPYIIKTN